MRLCEQSLVQLPETVSRPVYDRKQVVGSIVHLGVGAFHRAHQAAFTDAVLSSGDLAWGIVGAGMVSSSMVVTASTERTARVSIARVAR